MSDQRKLPSKQMGFQTLERSVKERIYNMEPGFSFQAPISEEQFIAHIIFFLYKNHYIDALSRKRYGEHYPQDDSADSNNRRTFDRAMKDMESRKREDEARRKNYNPKYRERVMMKAKEAGESFSAYHVNNIDRMAIENYSPKRLGQLQIVTMLADGRFADPKARGSTKKDICEAYKDYWYYVEAGREQEDPTNWIESLIDLSNLESQCPPGFLYAVAKTMDEKHVTKIPEELHILFRDERIIENGSLVESRFLYDRNRCISSFLLGTRQSCEKLKQYFHSLLKIQAPLIQNPLPGWDEILETISIEDAEDYFMKRYNLFESCSFPELKEGEVWTSSLVKRFRTVVAELTDDGNKRVNKTE